MNLFKNYKRLYEIEVSNRKLLEKKKKELSNENVDYQIKIQDQTNEIRTLKEEVAKLKIELEDLQGFKKQSDDCIVALRKEKSVLKRKITNLQKEMRESNGETN